MVHNSHGDRGMLVLVVDVVAWYTINAHGGDMLVLNVVGGISWGWWYMLVIVVVCWCLSQWCASVYLR